MTPQTLSAKLNYAFKRNYQLTCALASSPLNEEDFISKPQFREYGSCDSDLSLSRAQRQINEVKVVR